MHDSRKRFLLLLVAVLALVLAPVAFAQEGGVPAGQQDQDRDQLQQRVRDRIHVEDPDVEIAHNDRLDEDGDVSHDDRVVVDTVFSVGPGWLVVYATPDLNNQDLSQDRDGFRTASQCGVLGGDTDQDMDRDQRQDQDQQRDQDLATLGIVGYSHLMNGVNRGIEVPVDASRATDALCLQLHRDGGEIGVYEPSVDGPVSGGLVINVIGGLLDDQGQLLDQGQDNDQENDDQDQDDDRDEDQDDDQY